MNGRAAGSAAVVDVEDRDVLDAELAQHHLAGNGKLPLQRAIGDAGVIGGAEVGNRCNRRP